MEKTTTKTTISLYLSRNPVERDRIHKLNLSRITEQALSSILDYVQPQNETVSSNNFLGKASFQKEGLRGCPSLVGGRPAKSVVRNGRVGSNPTPRAILFVQEKSQASSLF